MKRTIFIAVFIAALMLSSCTDVKDYDTGAQTDSEASNNNVAVEPDISVSDDNNYDYTYSYDDDESESEGYYCMGKNDTCNNKTSSPYDLYCYSCDPDNNNIEGDQSDGIVGDNDHDYDIDEDDWEDEWNNYLDEKLDDYDEYDHGYYDYGYNDYDYDFGF